MSLWLHGRRACTGSQRSSCIGRLEERSLDYGGSLMSGRQPKLTLEKNGPILEVVAFHESGHLVTAYRCGISFAGRKAITIVPSEDYAGVFTHRNILRREAEKLDDSDRSRLKMERLVEVCLGGIEAQRRYDPRASATDRISATGMAETTITKP